MTRPASSKPPPRDEASRGAGPLEGIRRLLMRPKTALPATPKPAPVSIRPAPWSEPPPALDAKAEDDASSSVPPPAAPLWGGRIRPGDEVGRGAAGSVLRGMDTKLRRELAIKVTTVPRE